MVRGTVSSLVSFSRAGAAYFKGNARRLWSQHKKIPPPWHRKFDSIDQCRAEFQASAQVFAQRRAIETGLVESLGSQKEAHLPAFCWICSRETPLAYDRMYSNGSNVNWRERLVCPSCGLNNRLRLSVQLIEGLVQSDSAAIYITEQVTPLVTHLKWRYRSLVASEFLGDDALPGSVNKQGIRHEDVTRLSFASETFDNLFTFDVLEHVPSYKDALTEFARVMKKGGRLLLSVPFVLSAEQNIVRARLDTNGQIEHLLPAEYHGDPVNAEGGVLCFYHFGWELLADLKNAGFGEANLSLYWSREYGHIGNEQVLITAVK